VEGTEQPGASSPERARDAQRLTRGVDPGGAFFALPDAAHVARASPDAPTVVVAVNEALLGRLGLRAEQALDRPPRELLGPLADDEPYRAAAAGAATALTIDDQTLLLAAMPGGEPGLVLGILRAQVGIDAGAVALEESEARHRALVESLAQGVVLFDRGGAVVARNDAAREMLGAALDDEAAPLLGEGGRPLAGDERPVEITRRTGQTADGVVVGVPGADGTTRWLAVSTRTVGAPQDGPPFGVVASYVDVTVAHAASAALSERAASAELASRRSDALVDALFAQSGVGLAVLDRDLRYVRVNQALAEIDGLPAELHVGRTLDRVARDAAPGLVSAARQVLATGEPLRNVKTSAASADDPSDVRHWETTWSPVRDETGEIVALSAVVVDTTARERADASRRRLEQVASALAEAITPDDVGRVIVRHGVSALGGAAGSVSLLADDGDTLAVVAAEGFPKQRSAALGSPRLRDRQPLGEAVRRRRAVFVDSPDALARSFPALAAAGATPPFQAFAALPLIAHGRVLGALAIAFRAARAFDLHTRTVLRTLADQCALALDRSLAYDRQRSTARLLTQSLLPTQLPEIPGIELTARFEPAAQSDVGGDLYDVFPTGSGDWLLVVGDVCGKGAAAAAMTALVRYTLRAEALHDPAPRRLLSLLNRAVLAQRAEDRFCTATCVRLHPLADGHVEATTASGGHPLPLVLRADGSVEELGRAGPLLGVLDVLTPPETTVVLRPGDVLLMFTDGLLEAAAPERILAPADLARLLVRAGHLDVEGLADHVHAGAVAAVHGPPRDDVAILAAGVTATAVAAADDSVTQPALRLWLAPEPRSPSLARAAMSRLDGLGGRALQSARTAVTELVDNAVVHAGLAPGELIELHAARGPTGVVIEVIDGGPGFDPANLPRPPAAAGGRGLRLVAAMSSRWGVERGEGRLRVWCEIALDGELKALRR
jgi:PAS domain S-box-containing protein